MAAPCSSVMDPLGELLIRNTSVPRSVAPSRNTMVLVAVAPTLITFEPCSEPVWRLM